MAKPKIYVNKIELMLGLGPTDLEELRKRSRPHQQRLRQRRRWAAHLERKQSP